MKLNKQYDEAKTREERAKVMTEKRHHRKLQAEERGKYYDRRHAGIHDPGVLSMIIDKPDTNKTTAPHFPQEPSGDMTSIAWCWPDYVM